MAHHNPPHPGGIVRRQCLDALDLSVTEAAKGLGVTRQALSDLINGRAGISIEMAIRLSRDPFAGSAPSPAAVPALPASALLLPAPPPPPARRRRPAAQPGVPAPPAAAAGAPPRAAGRRLASRPPALPGLGGGAAAGVPGGRAAGGGRAGAPLAGRRRGRAAAGGVALAPRRASPAGGRAGGARLVLLASPSRAAPAAGRRCWRVALAAPWRFCCWPICKADALRLTHTFQRLNCLETFNR